jgi:hypothetical protein
VINLFNKTKPASLTEWLEIATKGLAAPGRERITREIEAHFAAAVESHFAQGESEQDAQAHALSELGAPHLAAIKFNEQYLTESDEKYVKNLHETALKPVNSPSVLTCLTILPLVLLFESMVEESSATKKLLFFAALLITCILLPAISYLLARRLPVNAVTRWLLRIELLRWVVLGLSVFVVWYSIGAGSFGGMAFYGTSIAGRRSARLLAKLRKTAKPAGDTPKAA